MRKRRPHRGHGLGGLRLPDDVSRAVHGAPDPRPDVAAVGLVSGRRDAARAGGLRAEHRLRPGASGRAAGRSWRRPAADAAEYRDRLAARGRRRLGPAPGAATSSRPPSSCRPTRTRTSSRRSTRARWRGPGTLPLESLDPASIAFVVISPNDPPAMAAHAEDCRRAWDPVPLRSRASRSRGSRARRWREGFRGAAILIVNEYEFGILTHKTGPDARADAENACRPHRHARGRRLDDPRARTADGAVAAHAIPAARVEGRRVDPTGVGDMYRAGLLRGLRIGAPWPVAGRIGSVAAVFGLEALGPAAAPLQPRRSSSPATGATSATRPSSHAAVRLSGRAGLQFRLSTRAVL